MLQQGACLAAEPYVSPRPKTIEEVLRFHHKSRNSLPLLAASFLGQVRRSMPDGRHCSSAGRRTGRRIVTGWHLLELEDLQRRCSSGVDVQMQ